MVVLKKNKQCCKLMVYKCNTNHLESAYFGKIKASTLMETLVATALIVIVFMISCFILNNIFLNSIKNTNTQTVKVHLNELQYLIIHKKIELPYSENFKNWVINVEKFYNSNEYIIEYEAINKSTNKKVNIIEHAFN